MFNYIGQSITLLAAAVAVKGGTWDKKKQGIKKLTATGVTALVLAFVGFGTSVVRTYQSSEAAQKTANQLEATLKNASEANSKLEVYRSVLDQILARSDRQPQQTMAQAVTIKPGEKWNAPNLIYPGSVVKFHGFREDLILHFGGSTQLVPIHKVAPNPLEVAVTGASGQGMRWSLENISDDICEGKVFVISTPRVRSVDWSWNEEEIRE